MPEQAQKPGPPPALEVEIVEPSSDDNPIDVDNGMINIVVRATGGTVLEVKADFYPNGGAAPADPSFTLDPHLTNPGQFVGQIAASCHPQPPYAEFRIRAVAEFEDPSGGMAPNIKIIDDAGVFEGKCLEP